MDEFERLRKENPEFDDLCDARNSVLRVIESHQIAEEALKEKFESWDSKVTSMYEKLTRK